MPPFSLDLTVLSSVGQRKNSGKVLYIGLVARALGVEYSCLKDLQGILARQKIKINKIVTPIEENKIKN